VLGDTITVGDALAVGLEFAVELTDSGEVVDLLVREHDAHRLGSDAIVITDAAGFRRNGPSVPPLLLIPGDLGTELEAGDLATFLVRSANAAPSPLDITKLGLGLWLDASQGFTTDSGGVTLLPDRSGNGHDAAPGSFGQPQAETFPNGRPGIRFRSANLEALRGESLPSGDPPWTLMVVAIHEAASGLHVSFGLDTLTGAASLYALGNSGTSAMTLSGVNLLRLAPGLFVTPGEPDLMAVSWRNPQPGPAHREWEINGSPKITNTDAVPFANLFAVDGFTLGVSRRDISPFLYTDMVFGEAVLWTRELTEAERFRERQRLDAKWGINIAELERGRLATELVTP